MPVLDLTALKVLLRARDTAGATALVEAAELVEGPRAAAFARQGRAELALGAGDLAGAEALAHEVVAWATQEGDTALLAQGLRMLGITGLYQSELPRARSQLERATALFGQLGDAGGQADTQRFLAYLAQQLGRWTDAREGFLRSVESYRASEDTYGESNALRGAAHAANMQRDHEAAEALYLRAQALLEPLGPSASLAGTRNGLGDVYAQRGELDQAEGYYARALAMYRQVGDLYGTPVALEALAYLSRERGDLDAAESMLREGMAFIAPAHPLGQHLRVHFGVVLAAQRRYEDLAELLTTVTAPPLELRGLERLLELVVASHRGDSRAADAALRDGPLDGDGRLLASVNPILFDAADLWRARRGVDAATRAARVLAWCVPTARRKLALGQLGVAGARAPIGAFDLESRLGAGGMGTVWRARHREDRLPVAIKVLRLGPRSGDVLTRELRSLAALDHPNVVRVLGHGITDDVAAEVSRGALVAGSPYLVMELVQGGDLAALVGELSWPEVKAVLADLLAALAHAHARGLVHLDLKPENVLIEPGPPRRIRLTDLGIARALQELHQAEGVVGTPSYMAPEQALGEWHDVGPWTDLYALGCLAWTLVTGSPPFSGATPEEVLMAHVTEPVPALAAVVAVPEGLEEWLATLLAKAPQARWARALEAAAALEGLGEATRAPTTRSAFARAEATWPLGITSVLSPSQRGPARPTAPVRSASWTGADASRRSSVTADRSPGAVADASLFAWRRPPLTGRVAEREVVARLLDEAGNGAARALLVTGTAGVGTSRFVDWIGEVAHQGGADVGRASGADAAGALLVDLLRLHRPQPWEVIRRLEGLVAEGTTARVAEALGKGASPSPADTLEVLGGLSARRPLVLVADDAHTDGSALRLAHLALEAEAAPRCLWVLAGREDALAAHAGALAQLEGLGASRLSLTPLARDELQAMIRQHLTLEPRLEAALLDRAAGNPQYAHQVLTEWVERRALVPSPEGLGLVDGASVSLPAHLGEAWAARLDALCPPGSKARDALELGAVLGTEVDAAEWRAAAAALGRAASDDDLEPLLRAGLVARTPAGWQFAHAMAREAALARISGGEMARLHGAAADALDGIDPALGRRGAHLEAAGRPADAVEPLRLAANLAIREPNLARAASLLDAWERCADASGMPGDHPRRLDGWALMAELSDNFGRYRLDPARFATALRLARAVTSPRHRGRALEQLAHIPASAGRPAEAWALLRESEAAFLEAADAVGLADVRSALLYVAGPLGRAAEVAPFAEEVRRSYLALGLPRQAAIVHLLRAQLGTALGELDTASEEARRGRDWFRDAGDRVYEGHCENSLGVVARRRGELDVAEEHYAAAERLLRAAGSSAWLYPRMNRAVLASLGGRGADARVMFQHAAHRAGRLGWTTLAGIAELMATLSDPTAEDFDDVMARGHAMVDAGLRDHDIAEGCARAAALVRDTHPARAVALDALRAAVAPAA